MNCRPLFVGKNTIGDRFDDNAVFVFFGNQHFTTKEAARLFPERALKFLKQVHGSRAINVDASFDSKSIEADAFITKDLNVSLGVYSADCIPVLIHDPYDNQIAAIHSGWRGTAANIISKTLSQMSLKKPENVRVWFGPHIRRASFEVHNDVAEQLRAANCGADEVVFAHENDPAKKRVDLTAIAMSQAVAQGIKRENLWVHSIDTFTDNNYFSYRRSRPTGSLLSTITIIS